MLKIPFWCLALVAVAGVAAAGRGHAGAQAGCAMGVRGSMAEGHCSYSVALLSPVRMSSAPMPGGSAVGFVAQRPPRNDFDRLMREASWWHLRAWRAFNEECEVMEAWDSALMDSPAETTWRRQFLACDRSGDLRRARAAAQQAAALAEGAKEEYRAALLLAALACESGDHRTELLEARKLMVLAPGQFVSRLWLAHAGQCDRENLSTDRGSPRR